MAADQHRRPVTHISSGAQDMIVAKCTLAGKPVELRFEYDGRSVSWFCIRPRLPVLHLSMDDAHASPWTIWEEGEHNQWDWTDYVVESLAMEAT